MKWRFQESIKAANSGRKPLRRMIIVIASSKKCLPSRTGRIRRIVAHPRERNLIDLSLKNIRRMASTMLAKMSDIEICQETTEERTGDKKNEKDY